MFFLSHWVVLLSLLFGFSSSKYWDAPKLCALSPSVLYTPSPSSIFLKSLNVFTDDCPMSGLGHWLSPACTELAVLLKELQLATEQEHPDSLQPDSVPLFFCTLYSWNFGHLLELRPSRYDPSPGPLYLLPSTFFPFLNKFMYMWVFACLSTNYGHGGRP